MAYTEASDLKILLNDDTITDSVLETYIEVANEIVTDLLVGENLGSTRLELIERYYAAHLYAFTRQTIATDEKIGEVSVKFAGKYGQGLDATSYGQIVQDLDTTGKLRLQKKPRRSISSIKSFE
jgi:hypothetical protein